LIAVLGQERVKGTGVLPISRDREPALLRVGWLLMEAFEIADLAKQRERSDERYLEFLAVSTMSTGIYFLPQGAVDTQQPHTEDEVYYVVSGSGAISVACEDRPVGPGSVVFVEAKVDHRFHSITEDMTIFVVFAPARGSQAQA
jgi:mannose-6-phosphate isomerase-like protein (cupin superfamily)